MPGKSTIIYLKTWNMVFLLWAHSGNGNRLESTYYHWGAAFLWAAIWWGSRRKVGGTVNMYTEKGKMWKKPPSKIIFIWVQHFYSTPNWEIISDWPLWKARGSVASRCPFEPKKSDLIVAVLEWYQFPQSNPNLHL